MQSPIILFDHIHKTFATVPTGAASKKLAELLAGRSEQVGTSGRPS